MIMKKLAFVVLGLVSLGFNANAQCPTGQAVATAIQNTTGPVVFDNYVVQGGFGVPTIFTKTLIHGYGQASSGNWSDFQKAAVNVSSTMHTTNVCLYNMQSVPAHYSISVYLYY